MEQPKNTQIFYDYSSGLLGLLFSDSVPMQEAHIPRELSTSK
jgi:hypothetical protein